MLIDTHAHVNFKSFADDAKETLQRALDNGVWTMNVGSQIDTSRQAVELANEFKEGVYAVIGLHPEHTHSQYVDEEETSFKSREENFDINLYSELVKNPKVVGIGECGLDYYRLPEDKNLHIEIKQKQIEAFRKQIQFAKEHDKVLVVHSRPEKGNDELFEDLLQILKEYITPTTPSAYGGHPSLSGGETPAVAKALAGKPQISKDGLRSLSSFSKEEYPAKRGDVVGAGLRFEIHSYTGSPEYFQKFLDLGAYISFNGIITFDKTGNMEQLVKLAPLDKILLETDCPYLSPVPMRGKRNEPVFVKYVAEKVAEIKGLAVDETAKITTENARRLFKL